MRIGEEKYGIEMEFKQKEVRELLSVGPDDVETNSTLTYAKNVFIPLTTACRYTCTYCTYFDPPGKASLLSPEEVRGIVKRGIELGCTEALFTFGDDPDERYVEIYRKLNEWGHKSIHTYLEEMCRGTNFFQRFAGLQISPMKL